MARLQRNGDVVQPRSLAQINIGRNSGVIKMSNQEQAELWNGRMGTAWVSVEDYIDRMLAPISQVGIERAGPGAGDKVIDIGCGCGTTSLELAADGASVWGVDISQRMIERANAKDHGGASVRFSVADAAIEAYDAEHDVVFSRFGVMFFSDPIAAFQNIRAALRPGGRLVYLCWQAPQDNPWLAVAGAAVAPFMPADTPAPDPAAPGPFSMADPVRTRNVLEEAGLVDINIESVERDLHLGNHLDELMAFQKKIGPLSALLESGDEETGLKATAAVREAFAAHLGDNGVTMRAAAWLVTGRAP